MIATRHELETEFDSPAVILEMGREGTVQGFAVYAVDWPGIAGS